MSERHFNAVLDCQNLGLLLLERDSFLLCSASDVSSDLEQSQQHSPYHKGKKRGR